ncbi:hypothetical protein ACFRKB_35085 [Streptomyces scopuliridis]|uniref:hypothetical protein n=1 Tax=Streptomyces scopuliridis TaxID=452529 RepID=UPI0036B4598F
MNAELPGAQLFFDIAHWIAWSSPYLAALVLIAGVVWVRRERKRSSLVHEALSDRVTVEVVPTSTFDPGEGEVGRWARHLGRVHHSAQGVPARGSAARLRYSAENSKMRCYLEGPATAVAVLAMPGFAEVEVRAHRAQKDLHPVRFPAPREEAE